jgi:hypothetical protein
MIMPNGVPLEDERIWEQCVREHAALKRGFWSGVRFMAPFWVLAALVMWRCC